MIKLHRNKRTGDYFTHDGRFVLQRGAVGWNVTDNVTGYHDFAGETLKEARGTIEYLYSLPLDSYQFIG